MTALHVLPLLVKMGLLQTRFKLCSQTKPVLVSSTITVTWSAFSFHVSWIMCQVTLEVIEFTDECKIVCSESTDFILNSVIRFSLYWTKPQLVYYQIRIACLLDEHMFCLTCIKSTITNFYSGWFLWFEAFLYQETSQIQWPGFSESHQFYLLN